MEILRIVNGTNVFSVQLSNWIAAILVFYVVMCIGVYVATYFTKE